MDHITRGRRLVELRESFSWSRAELARRSGVAPTTIKFIEDGTRSDGTPTSSDPRTLRKIAEALGYPMGAEFLRDFDQRSAAERFERDWLLAAEGHTEGKDQVNGVTVVSRRRMTAEYEWFLEEVRDLVERLAEKIERRYGSAA
jgi:transcriptional regulator with XRE-family HTH domain